MGLSCSCSQQIPVLTLVWETTQKQAAELLAGSSRLAWLVLQAQTCLAGTEGKALCSTMITLGLCRWHPPSPAHDSTVWTQAVWIPRAVSWEQ